jgi:hypothetical protein
MNRRTPRYVLDANARMHSSAFCSPAGRGQEWVRAALNCFLCLLLLGLIDSGVGFCIAAAQPPGSESQSPGFGNLRNFHAKCVSFTQARRILPGQPSWIRSRSAPASGLLNYWKRPATALTMSVSVNTRPGMRLFRRRAESEGNLKVELQPGSLVQRVGVQTSACRARREPTA